MPRVLFKTDDESNIGRGCHLTGAHMRREMQAILYAFERTAPEELAYIKWTEGWRPPRANRRDLHSENRAFDLSLNYPEWTGRGHAVRKDAGIDWGNRASALLGPDYQIVIHGSGRNLHVHIELDPR